MSPLVAQSCHQRVPSCWLGSPCASHGFNLGPMWMYAGPTSAQQKPIGSNLGSKWAPCARFGGFNATCWKIAFSALFPIFLASMVRGRAQDQVAHVKPNFHPNVPKLRHIGPPVGPKLEPTGLSSAQVRAKLVRVRPNLGQGQPSFTPVGCHKPASFLSVLFTGWWRYSPPSASNGTSNQS